MEKVLTSRGLSPTIIDEYASGKKNLDNFLKTGDERTTDHRRVSQLVDRTPGSDSTEQSPWMGAEEYDLDSGVLDFPITPEFVTGAEGFSDTVRKGVDSLLAVLKNFLIWLKELVYNKTVRLRHHVENLRTDLKVLGGRYPGTTEYPASIVRLATSVRIPENGIWVVDSLSKVHDLYKQARGGYVALKSKAKQTGVQVDSDNLADLITETANVYANSITKETKGDRKLSAVLPGGKSIFVQFGAAARFRDTKVGVAVIRPPRPGKRTLIADVSVVEAVLVKILDLLKDIEEDHRSQFSASRDFEAQIRSLANSHQYPTPEHQKAARRYWSWLVGFQQNAVSAPLYFVYDALYAAVEFCYANLKVKK